MPKRVRRALHRPPPAQDITYVTVIFSSAVLRNAPTAKSGETDLPPSRLMPDATAILVRTLLPPAAAAGRGVASLNNHRSHSRNAVPGCNIQDGIRARPHPLPAFFHRTVRFVGGEGTGAGGGDVEVELATKLTMPSYFAGALLRGDIGCIIDSSAP